MKRSGDNELGILTLTPILTLTLTLTLTLHDKGAAAEDPTQTTEVEDEYSDNESTLPTVPQGDKRIVAIGEEKMEVT